MDVYTNGIWAQNALGPFDDTSGVINLPAGTTSVRAVKNGMTYQFNGISGMINILDVPIIQLRVYGVNTAADLAVVQGGWAYNWTPVAAGVQTLFNVFDNGRTYEVRMLKAPFNFISVNAGRTTFEGNEELHAYFNGPAYNITIPDGVSNVRMSSGGGWVIQNGQAGDVITLIDNGKTASMTFVKDGTPYSETFDLDRNVVPSW